MEIAVRVISARRIPAHVCSDIKLAPGAHKPGRDDFVFPPREQLQQVAKAMDDSSAGVNLSPSIWLMRGCGLRISEALAVRRQDFRPDGRVLRVREQVTADGHATIDQQAA
jgi:integrase